MLPDLGDMIQQNQNCPLHKGLLKDLVVIMMVVDTTATLIREVGMDTIGPLLDMAEEMEVEEMEETVAEEVEVEEMVAEEMEAIIKAVAVGMIAIAILKGMESLKEEENLKEEEEDTAEEVVVVVVEDMIDLPPTMIEE